ncbi:MAG: flippase activity-associated protein Agl23 [Halanaeroarchaeum sp.]
MRRLPRPSRPLPVLVALAVAGLLFRLIGLGARVAHQDEARVAHWILHYRSVDAWQYRAIIHGPFLPHVNGVIFGVIGPSDFSARLIVAITGGLLPLAAWLFRTRLRDREVLALGFLLAANPILVYYSRFMRNDVLLGAFALVTLGLVIRAIDTGGARYLLAGAAVFGVATTTKENVLLYPVAWLGALVLLFDYRLFRARFLDRDPLAVAREAAVDVLRGLWRWKLPIVVAALEVVVIFVAFYAPKPDLYHALGNPARLPSVVEAATIGTAERFLDLWGSTSMQEHSYVKYFGHLLLVTLAGGGVTFAFSILGFLGDRYGESPPRDLVAFAFYWGMASLVGYPIVSDIKAAWNAVPVLIALVIPAAVGLGFVYEWWRSNRADADRSDGTRPDGDRTNRTVAALLLILAVTTPVATAVATSHVAPQSPDNPLLQYAQPSGDMKPTLHRIEDVAATNEGTDVLFYGEKFYNPNDFATEPTLDIETGGYEGWFQRLPLPWYFEQYDANVSSTKDLEAVSRVNAPVVITLEANADEVDRRLDGYDRVTHQGYLWGRPVVFFVRE